MSQTQLNTASARDMLLTLPATHTPLPQPLPSSCPSAHTHHEACFARSGGQSIHSCLQGSPGHFTMAAPPQDPWTAFDPMNGVHRGQWKYVLTLLRPRFLKIYHGKSLIKKILCYITYTCVLFVHICIYNYIYVHLVQKCMFFGVTVESWSCLFETSLSVWR